MVSSGKLKLRNKRREAPESGKVSAKFRISADMPPERSFGKCGKGFPRDKGGC